MLEKFRKMSFKDKNYYLLALEFISLKAFRLMTKWVAYGSLSILVGLLFKVSVPVDYDAVNTLIVAVLGAYWIGCAVYAYSRSKVTEFVVRTFYQAICYGLLFGAFGYNELYQSLDVIIPFTLLVMVLYLAVKKGYSFLEKRYLYKRVIDRSYMILGKDKQLTSYDEHFYYDVCISDVDLRMRTINERVILRTITLILAILGLVGLLRELAGFAILMPVALAEALLGYTNLKAREVYDQVEEEESRGQVETKGD